MNSNSADHRRIAQLVSAYSPADPPQLPLGFGDYLSLLRRIDYSADYPAQEKYYRRCVQALAQALGFAERGLGRMVKTAQAGEVCARLESTPYRGTGRLVDAQDRRAAIRDLVDLRLHILEMGAYRQRWTVGWPGSRMLDGQLRERLFAVFFTAFDSQYRPFSRLILVIDIVLQELLLGHRHNDEVSLIQLIQEYGYPDPEKGSTRAQFEP